MSDGLATGTIQTQAQSLFTFVLSSTAVTMGISPAKLGLLTQKTQVPFQPPISGPDQNPQAGAGEGGGLSMQH